MQRSRGRKELVIKEHKRECMFYSYLSEKLCVSQDPSRKERTHSIGFIEKEFDEGDF